MTELSEVHDKIREGVFTLKTLTVDEVKSEMQTKILQKKGLNSHVDIDLFTDISDHTVASYIKQMTCKEVKGKIQASSRVEPFNDIKNCTAKASGMLAINEIVDEQHFHSDDEVGLFLYWWGADSDDSGQIFGEESHINQCQYPMI